MFILGCDTERSLVPNTHDGKVPDVVSFSARVDSTSVTKKKIVRMTWGYDTARYGVDRKNANLLDWEVTVAKEDTVIFESRGRTFVPSFIDSANDIQLGARESLIVFYKIFPTGYNIDHIQFIGRPSDPYKVVIRKKE